LLKNPMSKLPAPPSSGSPDRRPRQSFLKLLRRALRLEARAIEGRRAEFRQRVQIFRRSPHAGEALRYQFDLLPETFRQLAGEHRRRRVLMRALLRLPESRVSRADVQP